MVVLPRPCDACGKRIGGESKRAFFSSHFISGHQLTPTKGGFYFLTPLIKSHKVRESSAIKLTAKHGYDITS